MLEKFSHFFLNFSNQTVIIPLVVIGFIAFNRNIWGQALLLLLFNIVFATFLKNLFGIPSLTVHGHYAFPSGHMQTSWAFYIWLIWWIRDTAWRAFSIIILLGIMFGLIYLNYHNMRDIIGGVFFGSLSVVIFYYLKNLPLFRENFARLGIILVLPMAIMMIFIPKNLPHIWMAFYAIIGFSIAWGIFYKNLMQNLPLLDHIICAFVTIGTILIVLRFNIQVTGPLYISNIKWFVIAGLVPTITGLYSTAKLRLL